MRTLSKEKERRPRSNARVDPRYLPKKCPTVPAQMMPPASGGMTTAVATYSAVPNSVVKYRRGGFEFTIDPATGRVISSRRLNSRVPSKEKPRIWHDSQRGVLAWLHRRHVFPIGEWQFTTSGFRRPPILQALVWAKEVVMRD